MQCIVLVVVVLILGAASSYAEQGVGSTFSAATLQRGIEAYLREQLGPDDEISFPTPLQDIHFDEPMVVAHCRSTGRLAGRTEVELSFVVGSHQLHRIRVPVVITPYRMVPIAKHGLERGVRLTSDDIAFERRDATRLLDLLPDSLVGMRIAQSVTAGTPLLKSLLLGSGSVRNGEQVTLVLRSGAIVIRTQARTLHSAEVGRTVKVRRDDTGAVFIGRLTDEKTVVVELNRNSTTELRTEVP
jgi:flagella basal body P-ring formation protein FlgA